MIFFVLFNNAGIYGVICYFLSNDILLSRIKSIAIKEAIYLQLNLKNYLVSELQSLVKESILGEGHPKEIIDLPKDGIASLQNITIGNIEYLIKPKAVLFLKKMLPSLKNEFPGITDIQMNISIIDTKEGSF